MAKIIKSDGREAEVIVPAGAERLEFLQNIVGGLIEPVRLGKKMIMLVNEEGYILNLPVNERASIIAGQGIVGDVIIVEDGKEFN